MRNYPFFVYGIPWYSTSYLYKLFKKLILKEKNKREGVQNIQKWFGKAKKKKVSGIEENIVSVSSESDESIEVIPDDPDPAVANSKFVIKIWFLNTLKFYSI